MQEENTEVVFYYDSGDCYQFGMKLLTKLRKQAGLTQLALAKLAGTSQPQIRRLENDERELTGAWALRLARHLKSAPEELVFGGLTVPLVGYVGAGSEAHFYADADEHGRARFPRGGTLKTAALETRGDSMGPAFDGWIVYYDDVREPPTDDLLGKICVVWLHSGQVLVKTLLRGRIANHFDLLSNTGSLMTDQVVVYAARVTAMAPPTAKVEIESQDIRPQRVVKQKKKKRASRHA